MSDETQVIPSNSTGEIDSLRLEVQGLVTRLTDEAKMTQQEISEALDGRVSTRTIYRWGKGESAPGNHSDAEALRDLVRRRCPVSQ